MRSTVLQKSAAHFSRFVSAVRGQLGRSPAVPSTLSCVAVGLPFLNPNPRGTFSWPTSESPLTPLLPAWSCIVFPVPPGGLPLVLNPSLEPPPQPRFRLLPELATPASVPAVFSLSGLPLLVWAGVVLWSGANHYRASCRCCNQGALPLSCILGQSHAYLLAPFSLED